ncbi:MAG: GNAT family N-acetyltransferase [Promethearchaeota archaeon]
MDFIVGYNLQAFSYDLNKFRKDYILSSNISELDTTEVDLIKENPSHLIAWKENQKIVGWVIWHESSTREHRKGLSREKSDIIILESLFGGKRDIIELHELWLKKEYRGRGYGKQFFKFFEDFVLGISYDSIVYYTDDPAAIGLCRKFGYKETFNKELKWYTFCKIIELE